ncbi:MAG: hypothetical protein E6I31_06190 [Chloroflexi bacterium]|nr:MAG: hypothetical protein E6I31_06190 [Chloroflexota bacterium]
METRYDPTAVEQRWYETWEQRDYFKPRESLTGKTFTISMPPPNITGDLHMGHAMYTLQDVLIRWHRMLVDAALWVPGTDHAASATQNVLEKQLARKGSSKEAIGRQAWDRLVKDWYETTGQTILRQMRRLGFSADWSRNRFTMDPTSTRSKAAASSRWRPPVRRPWSATPGSPSTPTTGVTRT